MSRRRASIKKEVLPDHKYKDKILTKFMNRVMLDGKKSVSENETIEEIVFEIELYKGQEYDALLDCLRENVDFISINLLILYRFIYLSLFR